MVSSDPTFTTDRSFLGVRNASDRFASYDHPPALGRFSDAQPVWFYQPIRKANMNHPLQTLARILGGALFTAALACGSSALASPKDACSLVSLSHVQTLIGADGAVMSNPSASKNGVTSSYCRYG